jgi:hypothetical protein
LRFKALFAGEILFADQTILIFVKWRSGEVWRRNEGQKMLLKIAMIMILVGVGFVGLKLAFALACSVGGHSTPEEIWSGWAIPILTIALAVETAILMRK